MVHTNYVMPPYSSPSPSWLSAYLPLFSLTTRSGGLSISTAECTHKSIYPFDIVLLPVNGAGGGDVGVIGAALGAASGKIVT